MAGGGAEVSTLEKTPSEQQARGDELLCRNVGRAEVHLRLGLDSELRELRQRSLSQNGGGRMGKEEGMPGLQFERVK